MPYLRAAFYLAKKMGKSVGRGQILQRSLQGEAAMTDTWDG